MKVPTFSHNQTRLAPRSVETGDFPRTTPSPTLQGATRAVFARQVRDALANLHDVPYLQKHPLAELTPIERTAAVRNRGRSLRGALLEAVEALRPTSPAVSASRASRRYRTLALRYVEGKDPGTVQAELAISRTQYYRELRTALDEVVALLWERWGLADRIVDLPAAYDVITGGLEATALGLPRFGATLPIPLTSFVGREHELEEIRGLVRGSGRLVTLVGAPGAGKTRLALEAAAMVEQDFPDGVRFVSLAEISEPDLVASAVAAALGVRTYGGEPMADALVRALSHKDMLLVLDNFEHLVSGAPQVAQLLQACPRLRVLVTSRVALRVRGEREFLVAPLPLPDPRAGADRLNENPAVALFVCRAEAACRDFALGPGALTAIAEICTRLDGLPLAIELAAARVKLLPPDAILARLDPRLPLLADGARDLPDRQRNLRTAIDWSYGLLDPEEQTLFHRLGIFVGGWPLEAAEKIAGHDVNVLGPLAVLVDSSLVQQRQGGGGEPRFTMLETIREYARESLATSGEADRVASKHVDYYLALAEEADGAPLEQRMVERVDREQDNLRAALIWCIEHGAAERALRLAAAMSPLWHGRGYYREGRERLGAALALPGAAGRTQARARALLRLAGLARHQGDDPTAREAVEEAQGICRALGDRAGIAWALEELGRLTARAGDRMRALALLEASLDISRELGDRFATARCLERLAYAVSKEGDFPRARLLWEESAALYLELGVRSSYAATLCQIGGMAGDLGDYAEARSLITASLTGSQETGFPFGIAAALEGMAALAAGEQRATRAMRLAGAAAAVRERVGARMPTLWEPDLARRLEPARQVLSEAAEQAAWAAGKVMTQEEAICYALEATA